MGISVIAGMGEVGKALREVLSVKHMVYGVDINQNTNPFEPVDVLHICFPCNNGDGTLEAFVEAVKGYQVQFQPRYTVIHSTVPVGTCRGLGAYNSPIRGVHPYLAESIKTFWMYLAPRNNELMFYFKDCGVDVCQLPNPDETEAGKLWDLAKLAWDVAFEKEVWRWCQDKGLDWRVVYRHWTQTYNEGYQDMGMGMEKFSRPVLEHMEGKIGGHCCIQAVEKLSPESEIANLILDWNDEW